MVIELHDRLNLPLRGRRTRSRLSRRKQKVSAYSRLHPHGRHVVTLLGPRDVSFQGTFSRHACIMVLLRSGLWKKHDVTNRGRRKRLASKPRLTDITLQDHSRLKLSRKMCVSVFKLFLLTMGSVASKALIKSTKAMLRSGR